jgi:hypothetical protein
MKMKQLTALLLGSALALAATTAFAQNYYPSQQGGAAAGPTTPDPMGRAAPPEPGSQRNTGYGQGGTMGKHPTGSNVGPARGGQFHAN